MENIGKLERLESKIRKFQLYLTNVKKEVSDSIESGIGCGFSKKKLNKITTLTNKIDELEKKLLKEIEYNKKITK